MHRMNEGTGIRFISSLFSANAQKFGKIVLGEKMKVIGLWWEALPCISLKGDGMV